MFAHGLMFHHFCDDVHPGGQGAIDAAQFEKLLDHYHERILSASEWMEFFAAGKLRDDHVCLTFDDALRCQIDVALPVLEDRGLTAFWFIYSSVVEGNIEALEVYRYFRTVAFSDFDEFCDSFVEVANKVCRKKISEKLCGADISGYLSEFPFYSYNDRLYRYLRDCVLTTGQYSEILARMMRERNFEVATARDFLWMKNSDIANLSSRGHVVGLHSYTHPLRIGELSEQLQHEEYERNYRHILSVTSVKPRAVSHPCNSYDSRTIGILRELGIVLGFCSNMSKGAARDPLEYPREDHSNILLK